MVSTHLSAAKFKSVAYFTQKPSRTAFGVDGVIGSQSASSGCLVFAGVIKAVELFLSYE